VGPPRYLPSVITIDFEEIDLHYLLEGIIERSPRDFTRPFRKEAAGLRTPAASHRPLPTLGDFRWVKFKLFVQYSFIIRSLCKRSHPRGMSRFLGTIFGSLGNILAGLEAILGGLGGSWEGLGEVLGASWGHLGGSWAVLGRLGRSWDHLGVILGDLGPSWGDLKAVRGLLGAILSRLGAIFGSSWAILGRLGAILKRSGGLLG
jgi:hypothetical protein